MEVRINKDSITHIEIHDFYSTNYIWRDRKVVRNLWGLVKDSVFEEGWVYGSLADYYHKYTKKQIESSTILTGIKGELFENPKIKVFAGNCLLDTKVFENLGEAKEFCDRIFPNINTIIK